jgi:hypothetical protein
MLGDSTSSLVDSRVVVSMEVNGTVAGDAIAKVEFERRNRDTGGTVRLYKMVGAGNTSLGPNC